MIYIDLVGENNKIIDLKMKVHVSKKFVILRK